MQIGMSGSQRVTATATLTDGGAVATSTAHTVSSAFLLHTDPSATHPGDGTVTLTGYYHCAASVPTPAKLIVTATQNDAGNQATVGNALVDVTTCNGANHHWSVNISGGFSGVTASSGAAAYQGGNPLISAASVIAAGATTGLGSIGPSIGRIVIN